MSVDTGSLDIPEYRARPGRPTVTRGVVSIPTSKLVPDPSLPPRLVSPDAVNRATEEIDRNGLNQPLLVRPLKDGTYGVVVGLLRLEALTLLGATKVPCLVRELTDLEALACAVSDDEAREPRAPIEKVWRTKRLVEEEAKVREWGAQSRVARHQEMTRQRVQQQVKVAEAFTPAFLEAAGVPQETAAKLAEAAFARAAATDDPAAALRVEAGLESEPGEEQPEEDQPEEEAEGNSRGWGGDLNRWKHWLGRFVKWIRQLCRTALTTGVIDPTR